MVDVLILGAHPDDIEFGCGGIIAKLFIQKKSMVFVDLTSGDKGTFGTPHERREEGIKAAKLVNAERVYLDFRDCEIIDDYESRLKIVSVIRKYKPRIVLAPYWKGEQSHPDHFACGLLARYACRYARFAKILPEIPIHRPENILHYLHPAFMEPDFLFDVSDYIELWKKMMECHASQVKGHSYIDLVLQRASWLGSLIQAPYAQGLFKGHPVVIDDLMSLSKGSREI
jgi:bacillithiol biosynthesis deacetylase BshB1